MAERPSNKTATKTKTKTKKKKRISGRKWFYGIFFTAVIAIVCGIIGYLFIILNGERLLEEHGGKLDLGETSIIYDANEVEISRLYNLHDNRELAEFKDIPKSMLDAIVATEDQRFYEHSGIDFFSIGRAIVKDVIARSAVEGGSTITQQLAKNVFLTADKTFFRKATEASIAVALEHQMSKEEILATYLNRIYFGKGVYGVKNAAKFYFDKELVDLELWQSATLAGMPKAPNRYNPIKNPEDSMSRRAVVLKLMYDQGKITAAEMEEAKAVVYELPTKHEQNKTDLYPAFVDYVIEEAIEVTGKSEEELRIGGYKIYTTLNQDAQKAVDTEFNNDNNFEESKDPKRQVEGAMIIMDHRDGAIQAMSGGRDYVKKGISHNRVEVKRQPGSAIKPIMSYGPALETGKYYPWTVLANDKKCFSNYCPTDRWGAQSVTMNQALKDSRNLAAVWMLNEVGLKKSFEFATKLGIELEPGDRNLSIALGGFTEGTTPLQLATAYSVFANGGKSVDPHTIVKIVGKEKTWDYKAPVSKQLMSAETAWYMTEMMQDVVNGGTGRKAAINRPIAGKTGTTQFGKMSNKNSGIKDAWFVGYSPEWTAAVWMGYDITDDKHFLKTGGSQSAALFGKVMKSALKNEPKSSFVKPQGIKENIPPAAITNFKAVFVPEEMKVQLSWDLFKGSDITYAVYRKEASESDFSLFVDGLTETSTVDMSAFPGMSYSYYVVAYDGTNKVESSQSQPSTIQIPETEITEPDIPMEPIPTDPVEPTPPIEGDGDQGTTEPGDGTDIPEATPTPDPGNGSAQPSEIPSTGGGMENNSTGNSGEGNL